MDGIVPVLGMRGITRKSVVQIKDMANTPESVSSSSQSHFFLLSSLPFPFGLRFQTSQLMFGKVLVNVHIQSVRLVAFDVLVDGISARHEVAVALVDGGSRHGEGQHFAPVGEGDAPDLLEFLKDLVCWDAEADITGGGRLSCQSVSQEGRKMGMPALDWTYLVAPRTMVQSKGLDVSSTTQRYQMQLLLLLL